jgi:hypothetical protein
VRFHSMVKKHQPSNEVQRLFTRFSLQPTSKDV